VLAHLRCPRSRAIRSCLLLFNSFELHAIVTNGKSTRKEVNVMSLDFSGTANKDLILILKEAFLCKLKI